MVDTSEFRPRDGSSSKPLPQRNYGETLRADPEVGRALKGRPAMNDRHTRRARLIAGASAVTLTMGAASGVSAAAGGAPVNEVIVTAQRKSENVQNVPIAITALSPQALESQKIEGGPDLLKAVPNMTFSKTNFTGYNIQIRGIGTQAISATVDPGVAVSFNDTPFIRNHLFEQEFFDVSQVEVLRGPQGTLYGRNATAGVVNIISAKPTDKYEAELTGEIGNYSTRRLSGFVNLPLAGNVLDLRVAGAWTKRDGFAYNETTGHSIDGRDLWSGRVSLRFHPNARLTVDAIWEHFNENDNRARSTKQLCERAPTPTEIGGQVPIPLDAAWLSQGCLPGSLYAKTAFQTPNGLAIPFVRGAQYLFPDANGNPILNPVDPYASATQSTNLRDVQSQIDPRYGAESNTFELNISYALSNALTFYSYTGYNRDVIRSSEDYNRFDTAAGIFPAIGLLSPNGIYCDPQLGCSDRIVAQDLSRAKSRQFSQEIRLTSNWKGPVNFNIGANYTRYETQEDYFVFDNLITALVQNVNYAGLTLGRPGNPNAQPGDFTCNGQPVPITSHIIDINTLAPDIPPGFDVGAFPSVFGCLAPGAPLYLNGTYIDPNPLSRLNGQGHNYVRSSNPYRLQSYAAFGELYVQATPDLKLTAGVRFTDDRKRFISQPSWTFLEGGGYPSTGEVRQEWKAFTGRFNVDWTPRLAFTDHTIVYASYARGYKGGGANPPPPEANLLSESSQSVTHPLTFAPEFNNAFEIGTKNTLLGGAMTLNIGTFFYNYTGYQLSTIVDRSAITQNVDANIWGVEIESLWSPSRNLTLNANLGLEDSSVAKGQQAIDLMDRTAGNPAWTVVNSDIAGTSNCILPTSLVAQLLADDNGSTIVGANIPYACGEAYGNAGQIFASLSEPFDPSTAPNHGAGFFKDLSGHKLPNTPPFTLSIGAQYVQPLPWDWYATLRGDFYLQGNSYARVFNDKPYDQIHGYSNVNLSLKLAKPRWGLQVEAYVKNVFNTTAISGAFLNSDDSALTTNIFVTDPRLIGLKLTGRF